MLRLQIATQVVPPIIQNTTPSQSLPLSRTTSLQRTISSTFVGGGGGGGPGMGDPSYYRLNRVFQANIMELITTK